MGGHSGTCLRKQVTYTVLEMLPRDNEHFQPPSAPPEWLQTPVSTPKRIYPKLSLLSSALASPRSILKKRREQRQFVPKDEMHDVIRTSAIPMVPRVEKTVFVPRNEGIPTVNPRYWAPFLKKKLFEHVSSVKPPRSHLLDPNEKVLVPTKIPSLKKLKECGRYVLKYRTKTGQKEVDYIVQGNIIPTVSKGTSVIFDDIEKTSREFLTEFTME